MRTHLATCFLFVIASSVTINAQDWNKHRQAVLDNPALIRFHAFDGSNTSPNIAMKKDVDNSDLTYKTKHPLEAVDGPFAGTKAARLDAGFFESSKLVVDKAFCVEMRLRLNGAGTEKGNAGYDNGTLYGLGNGYDNEIRLTVDCPRKTLAFSVGRPENPKSRTAVGNRPVPDGVWMHVATSWDGKDMRIYVDGMLYTTIDYNGVLTDPCWGFRIGFNNAGVGSVKMDVAEVAVYKNTLEPEEILAHALVQPKFPEKHAELLHAAIDAVTIKDFPLAGKKVDALLALKMPTQYRFAIRKFRADIAAMAGKLTESLRLSATLLADPELPPNLAEGLLRRLIPTEYYAPLAVAPSSVYRRILDDKTLVLDPRQRLAVEKCLAESLFFGGSGVEAKKTFDGFVSKEHELNGEDLAKQNLSPELTRQYKEFRGGDSTPAHNRKVFSTGNSSIQYFIAPGGRSNNSGTEAEPFGSLAQARDAVRKLKTDGKYPEKDGVEIVVRGGVYPVTETFTLEKQDSGTETSPIVYRNAPDEKPIFTGGVSVSNFQKIDDTNVMKRIPDESRDKVLVASVPNGVQFPPAAPRGYGKGGLAAAPNVEMFIDDKPQQIARWPNAPMPGASDALRESEKAFVKTGKVHRGFFNTKDSGQPGIFEYSDPRHERWTEAKDAMLFGYWGHLWGITSCQIEKIDPATKQVVLATNNPYGHRENMPYYAFNLLEEIDVPGEWYLDRENGKLYVYPPNGVDLNAVKVRLSCFPNEFLSARDVSFTSFVGLHFEEGTGTALRVSGGEQFRLIGCSAKRVGNWGLGISGKNHGVLGCDFVTLGGGGIDLSGGDIKTLVPGNCYVENTFVDDFSRIDRCYAPAVHLNGVGNRLAYNLFCDSPGHAIRVEGMEHMIEFNEIHSIVYESDDQSGIDIWGNPFIRGMVFRYNYWHHIGSGRDVAGQAGIRLDDMISSVLMYGNVFFRSSGGHFGGIQIHGGKDNIVDGNLMIDCKYAVSFSPWGEKRWLELLDGDIGKRCRNTGFNPDSEVYQKKYPDYAELRQNADRNFVTRNAAIGCDSFASNGRRNVFLENVMLPWMPQLFKETQGMQTSGENRVPSDARKIRGRLSIPQDSPIYELLGIKPLPVDSMGLYLDDVRKEIPKTEITPFFVLE